MSNRRVVLYLAGLVGLLSPVYAATDAVNSLLSTGFFGTTTVSFIVVLLTFSVIVYLLLITLNPAERIRRNGGENEEGEDKVYRMISGLVGFIFAYTFWKYGLLDNFFATLILGGLIALAVLFVRRHEELNKFEVGFALMLIGYLAVWKFNIFSTWGSLAFWIGLGLIGWGGWSKIKGGTPGAVGWLKGKAQGMLAPLDEDAQKHINELVEVESKVKSADRMIFGIAKNLKESFEKIIRFRSGENFGRNVLIKEQGIIKNVKKDLRALLKLEGGEEKAEKFLLNENERIVRDAYNEILLEKKEEQKIAKKGYKLKSDLGTASGAIMSNINYEGNNDKKLEYYTEWILHLESNFGQYLKEISVIRGRIKEQLGLVLRVNIRNVESIKSAITALGAIIEEETNIGGIESKLDKNDLERIQKTNNIIRELSKVDAFVKKR